MQSFLQAYEGWQPFSNTVGPRRRSQNWEVSHLKGSFMSKLYPFGGKAYLADAIATRSCTPFNLPFIIRLLD